MGIHRPHGLVTFHGPVAFRAFTPYSLGELKRVLWTGETPVRLGGPPPFERRRGPGGLGQSGGHVGAREGARAAAGRQPLPDVAPRRHALPPRSAGRILFLEDVEEAYYRIDRMLTQLWLAGALDGVAGMAFGKFTNCNPSPFFLQNRPLEEILAERCRSLGMPAICGLMIGHIEDQATLPVGGLAELDADAGTLTLLEPGVG